MSNDELKAQFARCQEWQDPRQWELLAVAYYQRGYKLNAMHCFEQADKCRAVAVETEPVYATIA
ncbi:MAG: hypothetical protein LC130_14425 [Bryobacterales bacterium]|nr:hypothetical protein [Bryobacterales bacterium]MCZ2287510.1 hypothetical protein [Anaerolineales bacterium]